jgi:HSP20 family protein
MAIVQWDPSRELSLLQGDVNRLFERFFAPSTVETKSQRWTPPIDVTEEGDHYVLRADLPGMSESDVTIEVQDRTLAISGERTFQRKPEHDGGYVRLERAYGSFQRMLTLPDGVDPDAIEASFEHGVLELRMPKPVEAKPRRIEIGTAKTAMAQDGEKDTKRSIKDRVLSHA